MVHMAAAVDTLNDLYNDPETCASLVGLRYIESDENGIMRAKHGNGFSFNFDNKLITDKKAKERIAKLAIPPAWADVWICPDNKGHVLATGVDEKGRKQYIYHPKWRTMRDLIKFYRMITFAAALPKIRKQININLRQRKLSRDKVIAAMLWILDNCYIRIGNDTYFKENESVGLTTLTDRNVVITGNVVTLAFKGKSAKEQQITFENEQIATLLDQLCQIKGVRLFRYQDAAGDWHPVDSDDINKYLHELTALQISAKDFRTWGGTLMAFMHLLQEQESKQGKKPEKAVVEAVDQAAAVLGNTRTVAKSSYVHPHILDAYGSRNFSKYYKNASKERTVASLDKNESDLLHFLKLLFTDEFNLLKR